MLSMKEAREILNIVIGVDHVDRTYFEHEIHVRLSWLSIDINTSFCLDY